MDDLALTHGAPNRAIVLAAAFVVAPAVFFPTSGCDPAFAGGRSIRFGSAYPHHAPAIAAVMDGRGASFAN